MSTMLFLLRTSLKSCCWKTAVIWQPSQLTYILKFGKMANYCQMLGKIFSGLKFGKIFVNHLAVRFRLNVKPASANHAKLHLLSVVPSLPFSEKVQLNALVICHLKTKYANSIKNIISLNGQENMRLMSTTKPSEWSKPTIILFKYSYSHLAL